MKKMWILLAGWTAIVASAGIAWWFWNYDTIVMHSAAMRSGSLYARTRYSAEMANVYTESVVYPIAIWLAVGIPLFLLAVFNKSKHGRIQ